MSKYSSSIVISIVLLVLNQAPVLSQSAYTVFPDSMSAFRLTAEWTNILYFYCALVYFCTALALLSGRYFKPALLNLGISILSGAFMVFEPNVLTMMIFSGYQYTVKVTVLVAFITIFYLISLAFLFFPIILAFSSRYHAKLSTVFMNLGGIIIPPLLVVALYRVQSWKAQEDKRKSLNGVGDQSSNKVADDAVIDDANDASENEVKGVASDVSENKVKDVVNGEIIEPDSNSPSRASPELGSGIDYSANTVGEDSTGQESKEASRLKISNESESTDSKKEEMVDSSADSDAAEKIDISDS